MRVRIVGITEPPGGFPIAAPGAPAGSVPTPRYQVQCVPVEDGAQPGPPAAGMFSLPLTAAELEGLTVSREYELTMKAASKSA